MRSLLAIGLAAAAVPLTAATAASPEITFKGVGDVKLHASYGSLRDAGLVGKVRPGCELEAHSKVARLKAPLKGTVALTHSKTKRVRSIQLTGGAVGKDGVGIGSTIKQIKAAYPDAIVDHSTEQTFAFTLVVVPKDKYGQSGIAFAVDKASHKADVIGVPYLESCE